ncbi:hypothetical protein D9757_004665 [Collybiopsis confluens]|uniref:Arrestin C-terminal-like domain-containing protein n=1 Tax=Collybiopsis confluens TaxID=2823264 RepID=A0A8H5HSU9_9AGAR|nr:hypothetical protein D9757_004665 [Collybiopsis confluens]
MPIGSLSATFLEQAKPRARVEVDVIPATSIFVQGSHVNGTVKIRIRPRSRSESKVLISDGKIRVVGFECIQNEEKRHTFYQQSVLLSEASPSAETLYSSPPDNEGFYSAQDGVHVLPFSMYLVLEGGEGTPKGTISPHAGIAIRYILMISVKVREVETDKCSIAHFYRDCEIWPRLKPSTVLAPAAKPIHESAAKTLFMGGSGTVGLSAGIHRLCWVAGQQCCVRVRVINKSKKTIRSLTLTLLRSTVTYKPNPSLDVDGSEEHDADACQTSTVQKQVAENVLEMGQREPTRGHASAKGWWTGIASGETREFYFFLSLPSDAVTIPRSRLLEVFYNVRVTISAGVLASNLYVLLPIHIINFLSLDSPPTFPSEGNKHEESLHLSALNFVEENAFEPHTRGLEPLSEGNPENFDPYEGQFYPETNNEFVPGLSSSSSHSSVPDRICSEGDGVQPDRLDDVTACDDDDEFVRRAITTLRVDSKYAECGGRFADLYCTSITDPSGNDDGEKAPEKYDGATLKANSRDSSSHSSVSNLARPDQARPRGPSSFAKRVQQKLQVQDDYSHLKILTDITSCDASQNPHDQSELLDHDQTKVVAAANQPSTPEYYTTSRQRSSTAGFYSRPRHANPDEIELFDAEKPFDDGTTPRSPFAEVSRKASELSPPILVSKNNLHPGRDVYGESFEADADISQMQAQLAQDGVTKQMRHGLVQRRSHPLVSTPPNSGSDRATPTNAPRASEAPAAGNSVKDRIRMLEERSRAVKES